jgi:hypothetical protein
MKKLSLRRELLLTALTALLLYTALKNPTTPSHGKPVRTEDLDAGPGRDARFGAGGVGEPGDPVRKESLPELCGGGAISAGAEA